MDVGRLHSNQPTYMSSHTSASKISGVIYRVCPTLINIVYLNWKCPIASMKALHKLPCTLAHTHGNRLLTLQTMSMKDILWINIHPLVKTAELKGRKGLKLQVKSQETNALCTLDLFLICLMSTPKWFHLLRKLFSHLFWRQCTKTIPS